MKKALFVAVVGLMASSAFALPAVQLDVNGELYQGVEYIASGLWGGPTPIWDAVGFLNCTPDGCAAGDVPNFPLTWAASDLEEVAGAITGDGCPDNLQAALVAAVIAAGDPTVAGQFAANSAAWAGMIAQFFALIDAAGPVGTSLTTDAPAVEAVAATLDGMCAGLGEPYCTYAAQFHAISAGMTDAAAGLGDFITRFSMYVPIFEGLGPWFVVVSGTSAAMDATINDLMFNTGYGIVGDLPPAGVSFATLAGYLHGAAAALPGLGQAALAAALEADADGLDGLVTQISAITWPTMAIYGVTGKTASEPFSGSGDYNGNGDTNAEVAAAVGSDPAAFVAAASGANVWYSGNPALPVAGIFGLALLAGACVMGGAASIRRK